MSLFDGVAICTLERVQCVATWCLQQQCLTECNVFGSGDDCFGVLYIPYLTYGKTDGK
jgi:hypothetical protein